MCKRIGASGQMAAATLLVGFAARFGGAFSNEMDETSNRGASYLVLPNDPAITGVSDAPPVQPLSIGVP